jgi:hypothetical protein
VAEIVAAMAMTHSPGLTGWFTRASEDYQHQALTALGEMRRRLEVARPDVLVMFSNDHLLNWPINNVPEYTVGIAEATWVRRTGSTTGSAWRSTACPATPTSRASSSTRVPGAAWRWRGCARRCSSTTASRCPRTT